MINRIHQGAEIDFILQKGSSICGLEIKWTQTLTKNDFKGLQDMQIALENNMLGIVLYTGNQIIPFSKRLIGVPIQCLLFAT